MKTIFFLLFIIVFPLITYAQIFTNYTTWNSGIVSDNILAISIDSQGNKWFVTGGMGVSKFDGNNWTTYTPGNSGLADYNVTSIAIDAQGNKWFGTCGGVSKFDGTNWTTYTTTNGLVNICVDCIAIDKLGNKWFGTQTGVSKFDGTNWTAYTTANGLAGNYVCSIAIDSSDNKWFGTRNGVSKFDGVNWTTYNTTSGLAKNWVYSIAIDAKGNKWFGTAEGGVSKFDDVNWTTYNSDNCGLVNNFVFSIAIDVHTNNKWFGTGNGVSEFNDTIWTTYNTDNSGLANNHVSSIAFDAQDREWFGTGTGVSELNDKVLAYLNISTTEMNIAGLDNSYASFDITSNISWVIYTDQMWLTTNPQVDSNNATINVIASANPYSSSRTATVYVYCFSGSSTQYKTITVTQEAGEGLAFLDISTTAINITGLDNNYAIFNITSNISWWIDTDQLWLKIYINQDSNNAKIYITASANPTTSSRTAIVYVYYFDMNSTQFKTITVTQEAGETDIVQNLNLDISVYPDPVIDKMYILFPQFPVNIDIYTINGTPVYKSKTNSNTTEVDMNNYGSGLYFVKIVTMDGSFIKKIIKQ